MVHNSIAGCLSFHPMAQCVVHALKGLAEVTKNIIFFSMGPKLRHPAVTKIGRIITPGALRAHAAAGVGNLATVASTLQFPYRQYHKVFPCVQVRLRVLKGIACHLHVTPASSHASPEHSRHLRATLVAAPVLFAHAFGPNHMEKT